MNSIIFVFVGSFCSFGRVPFRYVLNVYVHLFSFLYGSRQAYSNLYARPYRTNAKIELNIIKNPMGECLLSY
ncbi:hypothetical protein L1987_44630 [Smallanthus sonchifolius]|uniref:Uncharacterized protein n=1 Tax=Smallanthus sonchifolius TaxID=185202 RepID=A0ACB9GQM6_9ASTR|nr:hypothetical protein L1987_44630 [Smallanthus sonchifolius]